MVTGSTFGVLHGRDDEGLVFRLILGGGGGGRCARVAARMASGVGGCSSSGRNTLAILLGCGTGGCPSSGRNTLPFLGPWQLGGQGHGGVHGCQRVILHMPDHELQLGECLATAVQRAGHVVDRGLVYTSDDDLGWFFFLRVLKLIELAVETCLQTPR
jgi:hypothetical protein